MPGSYIGAPAPTKFSPALDQSTVKHLRMTVKHVSKASPSVVHLYVQCGMVGFPVAIHAPSIPDIFVGDELVGEYLRGANPLDAQFTAIYSARMQPAQKKESPMTDIIVAGAGLSMTSLEISELVESRHDSVKRTIERLANQGVIELPPTVEIKTATKPTAVYRFTGEQGKRDSIIVVAQLSPEFTAKLVDRWQELEKQIANQQPAAPAIPQTLPEALRLAADLAEQKQAIEAERDEAVRTKAMISNKREASAMATASAAKREVERLKQELGRNQKHATITAVEQVTGEKFPRNAYVALRKWCKAHNASPAEVFDERYGMVKAWPAGAWLEIHNIDLRSLFGDTPKLNAATRLSHSVA